MLVGFGEVAERLNAAVLKTAEGASPPGVRIPLPPPGGNSPMLAVALLCGQRVFVPCNLTVWPA